MNLGALYGAKSHFLHTFCREEYGDIYRGAKLVLWPKVGLEGLTCQAGRLARVAGQPARVAGRPSFLAAPTLGIGCPVHQPSLTCWQSKV
jgi:hypothetical protein